MTSGTDAFDHRANDALDPPAVVPNRPRRSPGLAPPRRPSGRSKTVRWSLILAAVLIHAAPRPAAATWTRVTALPASDIYSLSRHGTTLYAGTETVVHIGTNDGAAWSATSVVHPEAGGIEAVIPAGGALWAGTYNQGVFRSTNGGASWQAVNAGLGGAGAFTISGFVERDGFLYAATLGSGVFALDLAAPTVWTPRYDGYPLCISGTVYSMTLSGSTIVAGAGGNGNVYRLPAGSNTWQEVNLAPGLIITDMADNGAFLMAGTTNTIHRSTDQGLSWRLKSSGFPNPLETEVTSSGAIFYAAAIFLNNQHVIYRSTDAGDSWTLFDPGVPSYLYSLAAAGDRLYAARIDGLWWMPLSVTGTGEPERPAIDQPVPAANTPNPFSRRTTITFALPAPGPATLRVHDIAGRLVATLLDDRDLDAGRHEVVFDPPEGLAAGVYTYSIVHRGGAVRRRMVFGGGSP